MMYNTNTNYLESEPFVKDNDNFAVNCSESLRKQTPENNKTIFTWEKSKLLNSQDHRQAKKKKKSLEC